MEVNARVDILDSKYGENVHMQNECKTLSIYGYGD